MLVRVTLPDTPDICWCCKSVENNSWLTPWLLLSRTHCRWRFFQIVLSSFLKTNRNTRSKLLIFDDKCECGGVPPGCVECNDCPHVTYQWADDHCWGPLSIWLRPPLSLLSQLVYNWSRGQERSCDSMSSRNKASQCKNILVKCKFELIPRYGKYWTYVTVMWS